MRDDYLWDGSGEPDPEIQKLETALGSLRHNRPAPIFPEVAAPQRRRLQLLWPRFAIAAAAILAIVAVGWLLWRPAPPAGPESAWNVTRVAGSPRVGAKTLGTKSGIGTLASGQVLETDSHSQASIRVEELGEIDVEPDTRLRLVSGNSGVRRMALERGTIHATIWAAPGRFVVDTPSAVAVDLGCVYTLHVDDSGNGLLQTTMGWVGFKLAGRESFIPAGAACATHPKTGPGTPYFEDAPESFRSALVILDAENSTDDQRNTALKTVLAEARKDDALTLWHLLSTSRDSERGAVYDRLAHLVPPPANVTRDGVMRKDQQMLDSWWNELGFGDISLWRHWEREWSQ